DPTARTARDTAGARGPPPFARVGAPAAPPGADAAPPADNRGAFPAGRRRAPHGASGPATSGHRRPGNTFPAGRPANPGSRRRPPPPPPRRPVPLEARDVVQWHRAWREVAP